MVWQHEAEIEVEAESERAAIRVVEVDFDEAQWEVVDCDGPNEIYFPPSATDVEPLPDADR